MANINIYDISNYAAGVTYAKDDIVKSGASYYYSLADGNLNNTPSVSSVYWGGYRVDFNGITYPHFFWAPSYGNNVDQAPLLTTISFGDGYSQTVKKEINHNLLKIGAVFNDISLAKVSAISHFLYVRGGVETFLFTPPPPYSKLKRFKCKTWNVVDNFWNNYSIQTSFEEVTV